MNAIARAAHPARAMISLDGEWQFRHQDDAAGQWRTVQVPSAWQSAGSDLSVRFGTGTYRRIVDVPQDWAGRDVALRFAAASAMTVVRINGVEAGRNDNGWLPFEIGVPDSGRLEIEVETHLPDGSRTNGDFAEIPHGKMSWYGPQGGLWQGVTLLALARSHIRSLRLDPLLDEKRLDLVLETAGGMSATVLLTSPAGDEVARSSFTLQPSRTHHSIALDEISPWSPDDPALYRVDVVLEVDGQPTDQLSETIGFRSFRSRGGKFYLNGEPFYMRGALDQDYYPDGFGTLPSVDLLEDQIRKAKAMGLNLLRCHIKVPDPRYYEAADRLGMLIWTEIPNIETFADASAARLRETMQGVLDRDRNHPCIVAWTIINEDWGTRLRESAAQRKWLGDTVDWLRAEDPLRLVVDNSACFPNYHVKTDINDYHYYRTVVERREEWNLLTKEFAGGAQWTFGAEPECEWRGDEPLVVSEFGVWGLPDPALLRDETGKDPWWMAYGATWAEGTVYPVGVEQRFAELGLSRHFGSFSSFIEAVQWHQYENLKYEIEVLRAHAPIAGYVITEFTDVHWEGNGLMDMARNPRVFAGALADINADTVIIPGLPRHFATVGETLEIDLALATGGMALPSGTRLEWEVEGDVRTIELPAVEALSVHHVDARLAMPAGTARAVEILFRLVGTDGSILARNRDRMTLLAERTIPSQSLCVPEADLADRLKSLGYRIDPSSNLIVARILTPDLVEKIEAGAQVLQLVEKAKGRLRDDPAPRDGPMSIELDPGAGGMTSASYFTFPGYSLVDRHHSIYRGDWVGNFGFIDRTVFPDIPGGPMVDLAFTSVIPRQIMTGFRPWEFQGRVHAGVVVGWVHKPGAFVFEKRLGKGKLVASTFRLTEAAAGEDAMASALIDGLVKLAGRNS